MKYAFRLRERGRDSRQPLATAIARAGRQPTRDSSIFIAAVIPIAGRHHFRGKLVSRNSRERSGAFRSFAKLMANRVNIVISLDSPNRAD